MGIADQLVALRALKRQVTYAEALPVFTTLLTVFPRYTGAARILAAAHTNALTLSCLCSLFAAIWQEQFPEATAQFRELAMLLTPIKADSPMEGETLGQFRNRRGFPGANTAAARRIVYKQGQWQDGSIDVTTVRAFAETFVLTGNTDDTPSSKVLASKTLDLCSEVERLQDFLSSARSTGLAAVEGLTQERARAKALDDNQAALVATITAQRQEIEHLKRQSTAFLFNAERDAARERASINVAIVKDLEDYVEKLVKLVKGRLAKARSSEERDLPPVKNYRLKYYGLAGQCHAGQNGECNWSECPQNNPETRKNHCPLDKGMKEEQ